MSSPILSIIIPTYNRENMLAQTLSLFQEQVLSNKDLVEFIVCNNASTDNTETVLNDILIKNAWFRVINYKEHVDIGVSISRSIENAKGQFFLIFGDDDVPFPNMIEVILSQINKYPSIGCMVFNRLIGMSDTPSTINSLSVKNVDDFKHVENLYLNAQDFIYDHYAEMGFISVNVLRREAWDAGKHLLNLEHLGYEFLTPFLYGISRFDTNLYYNWPLCIQREVTADKGELHHVHKPKFPLYIYVGIPRILSCLESNKIIDDWRKYYSIYPATKSDDTYYWFIDNYLSYSSSYQEYLNEWCSYQEDLKRIKITNLLYTSTGLRQRLYAIWYLKIKRQGIRYVLKLPQKIYKHVFK